MIDETTRRAVADRAGDLCEYCRCPARFSPGPFTVEHIHPRVLGGSDDLPNLAWSCMGCNGHKAAATAALDSLSGALSPLFHPRRQKWIEHFCWDETNTLIIGLTPTGRATIARLHLNRPEVVNLRIVLRDAGLHPPAETV